MASEASISVVVVYSPGPRKVSEVPLQVPVGCTVAQAIEASALLTPGFRLQMCGTTPKTNRNCAKNNNNNNR